MVKYLLLLSILAGACSNTSDEAYMLNGNPISFIMDMQDIKVSFLTSDPNKKIELRFKKNNDARLAKWNDVLGFLRKDPSYLAHYVPDEHDCKQFAYTLFENAQAEHYKAYFAILAIKDQTVGHAIVAIDTMDIGRVYVDFTPMVDSSGSERPSRRIVWVKPGEPYIRIPLENMTPQFVNAKQDFTDFSAKQKTVALELAQYNREFDRLDATKADLQKKIEDFKARSARAPANAQALNTEQDDINHQVAALNLRFDDLKTQEERIRSSYFDFDWVGKDWTIQSVKVIP